ncbi:AMP-binding protein [Nocardia sp. NPDC051929]|uniref:AMP-binding protein n=1 Tax=unclassified Nocardia TaxID=2637762 RepID=UPI00343A9A3F
MDLVVALLVVLKTGAGYVPVDLTYLADRIAYALEDSRPTGVIVGRSAPPAGHVHRVADQFGA